MVHASVGSNTYATRKDSQCALDCFSLRSVCPRLCLCFRLRFRFRLRRRVVAADTADVTNPAGADIS